ncbi:Six-hairpin glycosidase-like protein [Infundibulicybe gibba]|nr:Six-hairpin glycosidase-like protein [Infundibulicybe gibba]
MWSLSFLVVCNFLLAPVIGQLSLPKPPFLPPNPTAGTQPSSGSPNPQWSTLLGNLLYFYEAQRSGKLPPSNRVSWRNSSAVDDGRDVQLDLSGGYYDAGDYIKATFPLSFTLMSICWGATDFGKGYDMANQTAYLDDMLRWGLDWLIKAHPSNNTLYVQVGDIATDLAYWGGDLGIPTFRPSFQVNDTNPGTDVVAGASAAFSACSGLYSGRSFSGSFSSPASLQNSSYARTLLDHAQQLHTFAVNATGGQKLYQTAVPSVAESYSSSSYNDELTLSALFLSWATNSSTLFNQAETYYANFSLANQNGVLNWDSKTPALAVLFAQIARASSQIGRNLSSWQAEAERYLDQIVNKKGPAFLTPDGLLYYNGDSDSASLNPALNAAMLLSRYAPLASTPAKKAAYSAFAQTQVDYILGKNSMSVPYIVGSNPNSPANPHSAMASGGGDIENINTSPEQEAYVIYGALVGGPDKYGRFFDIRNDWPETEVALDYNAPMLTLTALHVINDTNDPFFTSLQEGAYNKVRPQGFPCDAVYPQSCRSPPLSRGGTIAMALIIAIVGLILAGLGGWYIRLVSFQKSV